MATSGPIVIATARRRGLTSALAAMLLSAVVFVLLAKAGIVLTLAGVAMVAVLVLALAHPEVATVITVFAMYANLAPVAVRTYHVPHIIAISVFLLLLLPMFYYVVLRREPIKTDTILPLMFIYLLTQLASVIFSSSVGESFSAISTFVLQGICLYFLILNTVRSPAVLLRCLWAVILAGSLLASLSILQNVTGAHSNEFGGLALTHTTTTGGKLIDPKLELDKDASGQVDTRPRAMGPIGDPNFYAQILAVVLPIAFLQLWTERRRTLRLLTALLVLALVSGIMLTFSRGGTIAIVVLALALVPLKYVRPRHAFVVLALAAVTVVAAFPDYVRRMVTVGDIQADRFRSADVSIKQRRTIVEAGLQVFLDHPLLGVGVGHAPDYLAEYGNRSGYARLPKHIGSHNMYLEILAETGVLGGAAFALILIVLVRRMLRLRKYYSARRPEYAHTLASLLLGIVAFLVTGVFLHMAYARYFWLLLALCGAAVSIYGSEIGEGNEILPRLVSVPVRRRRRVLPLSPL